MLDRCLLLHDNIPFLSYSNQSHLHTHRTTHTRTRRKEPRKKGTPGERAELLDRPNKKTPFRHCLTSTAKTKVYQFPCFSFKAWWMLLMMPVQFCCNRMWTARNTTNFRFGSHEEMQQMHSLHNVQHCGTFSWRSFARAASWARTKKSNIKFKTLRISWILWKRPLRHIDDQHTRPKEFNTLPNTSGGLYYKRDATLTKSAKERRQSGWFA